MTWLETFLGGFAGSYFMLGLLMLGFLLMMMLILRLSKSVFIAIIFVGLYALSESGYIPKWIFGLSLIIVGIFIGKMILNAFGK